MTLVEFQLKIIDKFPDCDWEFFESNEDRLVALVGDMFISYGERDNNLSWEIDTPHAGTQYGASLDEVDEKYLLIQG